MGKWSRQDGIYLWQIAETQNRGPRKIRMAAKSMVRVPMAPPALGASPYLAKEAKGVEPALVSLSQTHQGTKLNGQQAPTGAGQSYCKGKGH